MRIAIVGYGKMGKLIASEAVAQSHTIAWVVDPVEHYEGDLFASLADAPLDKADVIIDFATPQGAVDRLKIYGNAGSKVVMGTTGWYENLAVASQYFASRGGCIWSGNFSLGVQLFFTALRKITPLFNQFIDYDVFVHEYHHQYKADSPSGTALMMGDILLETLDRKNQIITNSLDRPIQPEELHVSSTRGGSIPGTHTVTFDSPVDTLEFTHRARSRYGFAKGAIFAAQWIAQKEGFYHIDHMMTNIEEGV